MICSLMFFLDLNPKWFGPESLTLNSNFFFLFKEPAEFHIDEVFNVDQNCIVGGLLTKGVIMTGSTLLLGNFT